MGKCLATHFIDSFMVLSWCDLIGHYYVFLILVCFSRYGVVACLHFPCIKDAEKTGLEI